MRGHMGRMAPFLAFSPDGLRPGLGRLTMRSFEVWDAALGPRGDGPFDTEERVPIGVAFSPNGHKLTVRMLAPEGGA